MLYQLFFITCMINNPVHCVTRAHTFDPELQMTDQLCGRYAQPMMAQWQNTHPNWKVEKFRCGRPPKDSGTNI